MVTSPGFSLELGGDERYRLSTTVYTGADDDQQKAPAG
jgi:hypothetical protein